MSKKLEIIIPIDFKIEYDVKNMTLETSEKFMAIIKTLKEKQLHSTLLKDFVYKLLSNTIGNHRVSTYPLTNASTFNSTVREMDRDGKITSIKGTFKIKEGDSIIIDESSTIEELNNYFKNELSNSENKQVVEAIFSVI